MVGIPRVKHLGDAPAGTPGSIMYSATPPNDQAWVDASAAVGYLTCPTFCANPANWVTGIDVTKFAYDGDAGAAINVKASSQMSVATDGHLYFQDSASGTIYKKPGIIGARVAVTGAMAANTYIGSANGFHFCVSGTTLFMSAQNDPTTWPTTIASAFPATASRVLFFGGRYLFNTTSGVCYYNTTPAGAATNGGGGSSNHRLIIGPGGNLYGLGSFVYKSTTGGISWTAGVSQSTGAPTVNQYGWTDTFGYSAADALFWSLNGGGGPSASSLMYYNADPMTTGVWSGSVGSSAGFANGAVPGMIITPLNNNTCTYTPTTRTSLFHQGGVPPTTGTVVSFQPASVPWTVTASTQNCGLIPIPDGRILMCIQGGPCIIEAMPDGNGSVAPGVITGLDGSTIYKPYVRAG